MRCPASPGQGARHPQAPKAMENPPEAYEEEAETEPESEDRAREDVETTRNALPDGRMECEFCGRKFNPASYERHQPICQKVFGGTRPQFLKSHGAGKGGDRVRVDRGAPGGQSLQNGQSPRSLAKASSTQKSGQRPESGQSPRGQGAAASKNPATLQRTDGPIEPPQRESDQLLANREDPCDLEQRVMQVMHEHMEELRSLRQQVREEPVESHSKVGSSSPRTKVNSADNEGELGTLSGASGAPRPQERARRSPKRANPEERLLPQPKKGAGEDRIPAKSPPSSLVSAAEMQLIPCEDCGRRFNPASLEKHRAVCRSVFGKTRSTFESQNQRLRGVKETASENEASTPAPRRRHQAVLEAKVETQPVSHAFAFAPTLSAPRAVEAGERSSKGAVSPRRARELDLQPCPHCKRSFRPAVVDKHVKVCKSVFHAHDPKRNANGREQRNTKSFEAASDAKAKAKPTPRGQLEVEQVKVDVSESVPMTFGDQGCEPASPIWSLAFEVPEVQAVGRARDGLDIWEQEVEEAIQAMSEPAQDISLTMDTPSSSMGIPGQFLQDAVSASPLKGSCRSLEERSTLLERARLGMKMGRPRPQALFGSNGFSSADRCGSETILQTSDRYQADLSQPAPFGFGFFQATTSTSYEVAYRRGAPDYLSRSQPVVPIVGEAPLSSRSERTIEVGKVSPQRRLSFQSGASSSGVLGLAKDGLRLPVQRRELEEPARPSEVSRAIGFGSQALKVKPGVAREDPAPARISMSQSFTLSASSTSPLQPRSGSMQLPVRSQRTPREHWQAAVPAAPPPSPSIPSRQRMAKVAPTQVPSVASPRVSPAVRPMSGVASRAPCTSACTASPLLRVRSVEPPHRVPRMVSPQHRMVPRLDLAKLKRR